MRIDLNTHHRYQRISLIVRQGIGIQGYFISVSAGPLVGTAIYTIVGKHYKYYSLRSLSGNVPLIKNMLVYALPLVPNTLFWWLGTSINRFFITGMLGIGASGLYAAASKIPNLLNLAYSIFSRHGSSQHSRNIVRATSGNSSR